jgi:CBS domain-containing protein
VHASWLLIEILLVGTVLFVELPLRRPDWADGERAVVALLVGIAFLGVTLLHEAAHQLVGARLAVPRRDVVVHAFGAASPLDGGGRPRAELVTALAGPATSALTAAVLLALAVALAPAAGLVPEAVAEIGLVVGLLAAATAVANLVPVVPLDGARALRSAVALAGGSPGRPERAVGIAGQAIGWAVVGAGAFIFVQLDPLSGALIVLLGLFLRTIARSTARQRELELAIVGMTVGQVMESGLPFLPPSATLDAFARRLEGPGEQTALPVGSPGEVLGVIGLRDLRQVAERDRAAVRAVQAMTPLSDLPAVAPGDDLASVVAVLGATRADAIPVVDGGRFVGLLSRYAVGKAIGIRAAAAREGN